MAVCVCGGFAGIAFHFDLRGGLSSMNLTFENNGKTGSINVGTGTLPGVLFLVTCLWSLAVCCNGLFAVGFRDCMMFGASVIPGNVTMGVLLIVLCSSSRTACVRASCTLCSSTLGGGAKCFLIPCSSCWSNSCHFGVTGLGGCGSSTAARRWQWQLGCGRQPGGIGSRMAAQWRQLGGGGQLGGSGGSLAAGRPRRRQWQRGSSGGSLSAVVAWWRRR
jgi:hypothetical protein